jgi:hypothetical protein
MALTELSGWKTQASSSASLDGAAYAWEAVSHPVSCFHVALIAVSIKGTYPTLSSPSFSLMRVHRTSRWTSAWGLYGEGNCSFRYFA